MKKHLLLLVASVVSVSAHGAGFEKYIMWSGRHAGSANTAAATVVAAESLAFNPAGLAVGEGTQATLNVSPSSIQFEGPIVTTGAQLQSDKAFIPAFGAFASHKLSPQLGVGAGVYVAGGSTAKYPAISYAAVDADFNTLTPDNEAKVQVIEASLGAGYELSPGLRVGAAYRMAMVSAALSASFLTPAQVAPTDGLVAIQIADMKKTVHAFRLGLQYQPEGANWGLGLMYRSQVKFVAQGAANGQFESVLGGATNQLGTGTATVTNRFPQQLALGAFYGPENARFLLQYEFTQYAVNRKVEISGTLSGGTQLSGITQNWTNGHNLKLGAEFGDPRHLPIRAGIQLTGQVTSKDFARATFPAPTIGKTIILGSAYDLSEKIDLNFAAEYGFLSTTLTAADIPSGSTPAGDYKTTAMAIHTGMMYRF